MTLFTMVRVRRGKVLGVGRGPDSKLGALGEADFFPPNFLTRPPKKKPIRDFWDDVSWWRVRPMARAPLYERFRV